MRELLVAVTFLVGAATARADSDRAKQLFLEGEAAFNAGRFDAAATAFEKAFAESPRAQLLWNLAQARRKQYEIDRDPINLRKACVVYGHYAELADDEAGRREALEAKMVCDGAIAQIDSADAAARAAKQKAALPPTETRRYRWPGLAIAGGGLLVLAAGLTFGLLSADAAASVEAGAQSHPPARFSLYAADESRGQTFEIISYVFYGAGAFLVAAGAAYAFAKLPPRGRSIALAPSPAGLQVVGRW